MGLKISITAADAQVVASKKIEQVSSGLESGRCPGCPGGGCGPCNSKAKQAAVNALADLKKETGFTTIGQFKLRETELSATIAAGMKVEAAPTVKAVDTTSTKVTSPTQSQTTQVQQAGHTVTSNCSAGTKGISTNPTYAANPNGSSAMQGSSTSSGSLGASSQRSENNPVSAKPAAVTTQAYDPTSVSVTTAPKKERSAPPPPNSKQSIDPAPTYKPANSTWEIPKAPTSTWTSAPAHEQSSWSLSPPLQRSFEARIDRSTSSNTPQYRPNSTPPSSQPTQTSSYSTASRRNYSRSESGNGGTSSVSMERKNTFRTAPEQRHEARSLLSRENLHASKSEATQQSSSRREEKLFTARDVAKEVSRLVRREMADMKKTVRAELKREIRRELALENRRGERDQKKLVKKVPLQREERLERSPRNEMREKVRLTEEQRIAQQVAQLSRKEQLIIQTLIQGLLGGKQTRGSRMKRRRSSTISTDVFENIPEDELIEKRGSENSTYGGHLEGHDTAESESQIFDDVAEEMPTEMFLSSGAIGPKSYLQTHQVLIDNRSNISSFGSDDEDNL